MKQQIEEVADEMYLVLAVIREWWRNGDEPLHSGALLFDDERTLKDHVIAALAKADEPQEGTP